MKRCEDCPFFGFASIDGDEGCCNLYQKPALATDKKCEAFPKTRVIGESKVVG